MSTVLENIGDTPLVKLNKIPESEGLKCEICKYFSPMKDVRKVCSAVKLFSC